MSDDKEQKTPTSRQRLAQGARNVLDNSAIVILIIAVVIVLLRSA